MRHPTAESAMHRTQIYLTDTQYHFLHELAEKKQLSMAEVIRNLIDKCLPQVKDYKTNDLFSLGKDGFTMGKPEGSVDHDKYIYGSETENKEKQ